MVKKKEEPIVLIEREFSRNIEDYGMTQHAFLRRKRRDIDTERIIDAIEKGHVQEAKGGYPNIRFIERTKLRPRVGVVANCKNGKISTVFWNSNYDLE